MNRQMEPTSSSCRREVPERELAMRCFAEGKSIAEVARLTQRASSTCESYLAEYLERIGATHARPWVSDEECVRVIGVATQLQSDNPSAIHEAAGGKLAYGAIRVALAVFRSRARAVAA
jgi:DNA-binding NarL/FixJ family response regulator